VENEYIHAFAQACIHTHRYPRAYAECRKLDGHVYIPDPSDAISSCFLFRFFVRLTVSDVTACIDNMIKRVQEFVEYNTHA